MSHQAFLFSYIKLLIFASLMGENNTFEKNLRDPKFLARLRIYKNFGHLDFLILIHFLLPLNTVLLLLLFQH